MLGNRAIVGREELVAWAQNAFRLWAETAKPTETDVGTTEESSPAGLVLYLDLLKVKRGDLGCLLPISDRIAGGLGKPLQPTILALETILTSPAASLPPEELWRGFCDELGDLPSHHHFESFGHLFRKYTWAVPCTLGDPYCSLYEEFKTLSALVWASECTVQPAKEFLLVGGDIPGIQSFLYTLTSKGAAKGLRGRSFFLQLLGDALVRRLVDDLDLCWANIIYQAGGNFLLLAPATDKAKATVERLRHELNAKLLAAFGGDLSLALASTPVASTDVVTCAFMAARECVGRQVSQRKEQRFLDLLTGDSATDVLGPHGEGGDEYCQVCHNEPGPADSLDTTLDEDGTEIRICHMCQSFGKLAEAIAHDPLWMIVERYQPGSAAETWQSLLGQISGYYYSFASSGHKPPDEFRRVYGLNDTTMSEVTGFRFLANSTPRLTDAEAKRLNALAPETKAQAGQIKDFGLMAAQAGGVERVGILRMDVDDMGKLFSQELQGNMGHLSRLSDAMDLFFNGYLNRLCAGIERDQAQTVYVIYAGGDDLFIVGAWDRLPELAWRIREDLGRYVRQHPRFTISGGMTLEGAHFPLYRAAERSGEAEQAAKHYRRPDGRGKDAFCLLGVPVAWGDWSQLVDCRDKLQGLIAGGVARSLLQTLQGLDAQWRQAKKEAPGKLKVWGRWNWMAAYTLTRLAQGLQDDQKAIITDIQIDWVENTDRLALWGLAARWVELLQRGGQ